MIFTSPFMVATAALAVMGHIQLVHALPKAEPETAGALKGYTVVDLTWVGQVTDGGPNVTLTGTVETIYKQILKLNPDFEPVYLTPRSAVTRDETHALAARGISAWPPNCGVFSYWKANRQRIGEGINYLYSLGGNLNVPAGPGYCSRVSCSYNSGIYLCNDKRVTLTAPTSWVADYAGGIRDACVFSGLIIPAEKQTAGQLFDIDGSWNVIVSDASTFGGSC